MRRQQGWILLCALGVTIMVARTPLAESPWPEGLQRYIRIEQLRADLHFLAHDLLEGRAPGTRGGQLAALYIAARMQMLGLEPLGPNGSYFQPVPLIGVTTERSELQLRVGDHTWTLTLEEDYVAWPGVYQESVAVEDAPLVFVGYGIEAPEYRWNDYKDVDVRGKVLLMLVNDPPATEREPDLFEGKAMTYYGRWTYKYEEAYRKGARGAILVHVTEMAGYPWQVVRSSWTGEQVHLDTTGADPALPLKAWVRYEVALKILRTAGYDLDDLMRQARSRDFRPVDLGVRVRAVMHNRIRKFRSQNVAGVLYGRDPQRKREAIVITAHYDHLGIGPAVNGDRIYNGAYDNASGVAAMLGVAEVFAGLARAGVRPARSVIFLAVTAEESGLLGSLYYVHRPLWPLRDTVANLNLDSVNVWGPTEDFVPRGMERTTLQQVLQEVARTMRVTLEPDPFPEKGYYFRSDHFSFARKGVPAVFIESGIRFIGKPPDWGKRLQEEYVAKRYHQPSDEYDPAWELTGMAQTVEFMFRTAWRIAESAQRPTWKPGRKVRVP